MRRLRFPSAWLGARSGSALFRVARSSHRSLVHRSTVEWPVRRLVLAGFGQPKRATLRRGMVCFEPNEPSSHSWAETGIQPKSRRREAVKTIYATIVALGLAVVFSEPSSAATTDPEVIIYRFPGVGH
jgi:hypothetical protein